MLFFAVVDGEGPGCFHEVRDDVFGLCLLWSFFAVGEGVGWWGWVHVNNFMKKVFFSTKIVLYEDKRTLSEKVYLTSQS